VPVVTFMRFTGDPVELEAKVREHVEPVSNRLSPKHGRLANILARTADGIVVINLWETEEGRQAMSAEPEIQAAVGESGLPRPEHEVLEVLGVELSDRISSLSGPALAAE
jgi:hypothetical protein